MKLKIYSVYDNKTGIYARPFFARSDAEAERAFQYNGSTDPFMRSNAVDYDLVYLGEFDDQTAIITPAKNSFVSLSALVTAEKE